MSGSKRPAARSRSLVAAIRELAKTLPSPEEKAEAVAVLQAIEAYLADVRAWLERLPDQSADHGLHEMLARLEEILEQADQNALLHAAFGRPPKAKVRKPAQVIGGDPESARHLLSELDTLTVDQVRQRLQEDTSLTMRDLRNLAQLLSIRSSSKVTRDTLANQLTTRIANDRGYRRLSGSAVLAEPPSDEGS